MLTHFVGGIVGVPLRPAVVECSAIVRIERETAMQPFREIRIREKMPAKCDEIGIALYQDRFGTRSVETAGCDHRPSKQRTKQAGRHRRLVVIRHVAYDPRLYDMQISQSEVSESSGRIGEGHFGRAVTHATELVAGTDANADLVSSPNRSHRFADFD